jgi:peptide deformylase
MATRAILTAENPLLRQKSKKVNRYGDALKQLVADLYDTLHAANGLGLAAAQIGVLQRVFIVELAAEFDDKGKEIEPLERYTLINPEFLRMRGEEEMEEGCLSVPGYRGKVKRATEVTIKGYDLRGKEIRFRADGLLAHAFQHEFDHLEGILYLDRLESPDNLWPTKRTAETESAADMEAIESDVTSPS